MPFPTDSSQEHENVSRIRVTSRWTATDLVMVCCCCCGLGGARPSSFDGMRRHDRVLKDEIDHSLLHDTRRRQAKCGVIVWREGARVWRELGWRSNEIPTRLQSIRTLNLGLEANAEELQEGPRLRTSHTLRLCVCARVCACVCE